MIAVTGASGGVGGRVARTLAAKGLPLRLIVRDGDQQTCAEKCQCRGAAQRVRHESFRRPGWLEEPRGFASRPRGRFALVGEV